MLRRDLGVAGATLLGLGSILGTGVFVSIALVAGLAGRWTPVAVVAAALVATCNALSSAQLAAAHPRSGGTYEYGYRLLHPLAGFTAGWMFLCAKSASAAAAALGVAGYLLHLARVEGGEATPWVAGACVALLTALVAGGLRRSSVVNTIIVSVTLGSLVAFVIAGAPAALGNRLADTGRAAAPTLRQMLEATALMFVAYTGYGRVATLGEEVRDPARTIPRAIVATLVVSAMVYLGVAWVGVGVLGPADWLAGVEGAGAPLERVAASLNRPGLPTLLAVGAVTAMAGVLLNLLLGLSRVLLAMGRRADMPAALARVDDRRGSPVAAVVAVGVAVLLLAVTGSVRSTWSFSAFTVLVYYALTNAAALRLPP
ncbi:MAG TPA: APC family permease, partial [bacterium]|nr:APC family permease [bacterium]